MMRHSVHLGNVLIDVHITVHVHVIIDMLIVLNKLCVKLLSMKIQMLKLVIYKCTCSGNITIRNLEYI